MSTPPSTASLFPPRALAHLPGAVHADHFDPDKLPDETDLSRFPGSPFETRPARPPESRQSRH